MGSYRKLSKARLRQREKDQHDPRWLAWLAEMDGALETFFSVDVPDMPADPFTAAGLTHAEQSLMARFSSADPLLEPENAEVADRFQRYLGETFIRSGFEGRWMNVRISDDRDTNVFFDRRGFEPVVSEPFNAVFIDVVSLILTAAHRRTGEEWTWVYGHSANDYAVWVAKGRPEL
ncbi:hypothetical protein VMT65_22435 [Nocardia sp. CDC153]|uniref:hypothetical protein n=1 Tax=Nocardia sp. CDC153 TaxID=3112167 RepID=UPI002DBA07AC|nr:hypothetical protein [Nocardia sp. CDC153]MEC3955808.1 hypothetical protein [Nocardia sp. CDC153]